MSRETPFILPITVWGRTPPVHKVSCAKLTPDGSVLVTGSYDGHLCIWNVNFQDLKITSRNILICHEDPVLALDCTEEYAISCSEGGEMSRWNLKDGYCSKSMKTSYVHTNIKLFKRSDEELLFTCGFYTDVFVIDPFTLETIHILHSRKNSDWISCFEVLTSKELKSDVVSGITVSGYIKLWIIEDLNCAKCEVQSSLLPVKTPLSLSCNVNQTWVLVVSPSKLYIFDSTYLKLLSSVTPSKDEMFLGGKFKGENVLAWTNVGKFYLYKTYPFQAPFEVVCTFENESSSMGLQFEPVLSFECSTKNECYLFYGDFYGKISIWKLGNQSHSLKSLPDITTNINDSWTDKMGIFDELIDYCDVTASLYVSELDKFLIGCSNGDIINVPAIRTIMSFYFYTRIEKPGYTKMIGHIGKVNCLFYPYEKYSHFRKEFVISGGSDFTVCLWDIFKATLLHRFSVHGGEVIRLMAPPDNCNVRVRNSVCSVSSDHSVAILNLKERKCVILASRHIFPVVSVSWKPLDDFLIVECFDGSVCVWQLETGHLDRVLHGATAQEVIFASANHDHPISNFYTHDRNVVGREYIKKGVLQIEDDFGEDFVEAPLVLEGVYMDGFSESHLLLFNIECLITQVNVILKHHSKLDLMDPITNQKIFSLTQHLNWDIHKKISVVLDKLKHEAEHLQDKFHHHRTEPKELAEASSHAKHKCASLKESTMQMSQFLVSILHAWGLDTELDDLLSQQLAMFPPDRPVSFSFQSMRGVFSLFLPRHDVEYWRSSSNLTAYHVITLGALANVLDCNSFHEQVAERADVKDAWLQLSSLQRFLFPVKNFGDMSVQRPGIEVLAKLWQNKCLAIRSVVRKMLSAELQSLDSAQKARLLDCWYRFLPHFRIPSKLPLSDAENKHLRTIALVLFGMVGAEHGFERSSGPAEEKFQSNYLNQTCNSLVQLMFHEQSELQTVAMEVLGRGFLIWEPFLKVYKIFDVLFEHSADVYKISSTGLYDQLTPGLDKSLTAHNTLKSIAVVRTNTFVSYLIHEITAARTQVFKPTHLEKTKTEMILIFNILLEEIPSIILNHLDEIVHIFLYCIDLSHLKHESLTELLPALRRIHQIHHCLHSQRIAVGLEDGSVVVHELRAARFHSFPAHQQAVTAVCFSPDGKTLASYSCFDNSLSLWQVSQGMFGLGQVHIKCVKSYATHPLVQVVRNHLGVASLSWTNNKDVKLSIRNGEEALFHL